MVLGSGNPFAPSVGSFQVPVTPPDVDPDEGELMTVCFNAAWLPFVLGALQQLTLQATWSGNDAAVLLAQSRAQTLLAMFGSPDGGCSDTVCFTNLRYNAETDMVQQTFDGGTTWIDQPGADPRHNTAFQFPPNTAEDPRCQGAANLTRYISDLISQVIAVVDTAGEAEGIVALLLALFVELGPFGILIDLVLGLAAVLFGAGSLALADAFTNTVYDQLTCIFFCRCEADGSFTAADVTHVLSDVNTQIGGLVYDVLTAMFFLMGEVGMSNAAATGSAPADCSGCVCGWCQFFDFSSGTHGWSVTSGEAGSWDGVKFAGAEFDSNSNTEIVIETSFTASDVGYVAFEYGHTAGSGGNDAVLARGFLSGSLVWTGTIVNTVGDFLHWTETLTPTTMDRIQIIVNAGSSGGATAVYNAQLEGINTSPFGADNC